MKFEDALPRMRKGTYMTRRGDQRAHRIRVASFDGTECFVARRAGPADALPQVIALTFIDILADDWKESDALEAERQEERAQAAEAAAIHAAEART